MKTLRQIISVLIAAGSTAAVFLALSSFLPADFALASLIVLGIAALARFDYSRPVRSLTVPARILRPALPAESAGPVACSAPRAA